MRLAPSRLHLLGLIATLLAACSPPAPNGHGELQAEFADPIVLPDSLPLDAVLHVDGEQVGAALAIAWEWPNQAYDDVDFWVASTDTPLPNPIRWAKDLHLAIPTTVFPVSVEHSLYTHDSPSGAEPVQHGLCKHACTTPLGGGIGFPIPPVAYTGTMVVQVEWATPPTRGVRPLIARVAWIIELE